MMNNVNDNSNSMACKNFLGHVFEMGVDAGICHIMALESKNKAFKQVFDYNDRNGKWSFLENRKAFHKFFSENRQKEANLQHAKVFLEGFLSGVSYSHRLLGHLTMNREKSNALQGYKVSVDFLHMNIGDCNYEGEKSSEKTKATLIGNINAESDIWLHGRKEELLNAIESFSRTKNKSFIRTNSDEDLLDREWWWSKGEWWHSDLLFVVSLYKEKLFEKKLVERILVVGDMNYRFTQYLSTADRESELFSSKINLAVSGDMYKKIPYFEGNERLSAESMLKEMNTISGTKFSEGVWDNVFLERIMDSASKSMSKRKRRRFDNDFAKHLASLKAMDSSTMKIVQAASYAKNFLEFLAFSGSNIFSCDGEPLSFDRVICSSISQWGCKSVTVCPSDPIDMDFLDSSHTIYSTGSGSRTAPEEIISFVTKRIFPLLPEMTEHILLSFFKKLGGTMANISSWDVFWGTEKKAFDENETKKEKETIFNENMKHIRHLTKQFFGKGLSIKESFNGVRVKSTDDAGIFLADNEFFTTDTGIRIIHSDKILAELQADGIDILCLIGHPGIGKTFSLKEFIKIIVGTHRQGFNLLSLTPRIILGENMFEWVTAEKWWGEKADSYPKLNVISINTSSEIITAHITDEDRRNGITACTRYASDKKYKELEELSSEVQYDLNNVVYDRLQPIKMINSDDVISEKGEKRKSCYQSVNDRTYKKREVPYERVFESLISGIEKVRHFDSAYNIGLNGIIGCATIQGVVSKGTANNKKGSHEVQKNTLDSILPRFFGITEHGLTSEKTYSYEKASVLASKFPVMVLFVDEITGTEQGAGTMRSICLFLRKHGKKLKEAGLTVKVIIADASLVGVKSVLEFAENPSSESRILHAKEYCNDKEFSQPVSTTYRKIFENGNSSLTCAIIDCNAFPAKKLDISYFIPSPVFESDFSNSWSTEICKKDQRILSRERLNGLILERIKEFVETSKEHEQILIYIQDKKHLEMLAREVVKKCNIEKHKVFVLHSGTNRLFLPQKQLNGYKVIFITSTANRGVSFNNTVKIIFQTPSFSPEEQLAEIIQLVFRGRGKDEGGLIDDFERHVELEAILPEKIIRIPFHTHQSNLETMDPESARKYLENFFDSMFCSASFEILEQIALIRLSILTRILGKVKERKIKKMAPMFTGGEHDLVVAHQIIPVARQYIGDKNNGFSIRRLIFDLQKNVFDIIHFVHEDKNKEITDHIAAIQDIVDSLKVHLIGKNDDIIKAQQLIQEIFKKTCSYAPPSLGSMLKMNIDPTKGKPFPVNKTSWRICDMHHLLQIMVHFSCGIAYFQVGKTDILYEPESKKVAETGLKLASDILNTHIFQGIAFTSKGLQATSAQNAVNNLEELVSFFQHALKQDGSIPKEFMETANIVIGFPVSGLFLSKNDIERYRQVTKRFDEEYVHNRIVSSIMHLSGEGGAGFVFEKKMVNPMNDEFNHDALPFLTFCPTNTNVVMYREFAGKGYSASGLLNIMQLFSEGLVKWRSSEIISEE